MINRLRKIKS